jgi:hypothetical protein
MVLNDRNQSRLYPGRLIICLVLLSVAFANAVPAAASEPDCAIHKGFCKKEIAGRLVELDILPKPVKAMAELTFRVTISGDPLSAPPHIDLGMPGMHMGPNRVVLKKVAAGTYEGQGVIVRCPSGKRIWQAAITLPDIGNVVFTFDVVY